MKILVTGGHLTPALSLIDYIQKTHAQDSIVFVGREFSQDVLQQKAIERYEVEKRNVPFVAFSAVRLGPQWGRHFLTNARQFLQSIRDAQAILRKHKPAVVMSFGGYVAVPFALAARRLRIPVVTHEQTLVPGFANRLIGLFATTIAISFPQVQSPLFARKTVLTGNPLREGVFRTQHPRPSWLPSKLEKPLILVTGGNQGSRALNTVVSEALPELTADWTIVHQCGQPTAQENTKELLERARARLPKKYQSRYFAFEWIDDQDLFWLYRNAFCALARSGANSVQEFAAAHLPAIFVPLPLSRHGEQQKNAQWLVQAGGAMILDQSLLSPHAVLESIQKLRVLEPTLRRNLAVLQVPKDAAERLYTVLTEAVSQQ